MAEFLLELSLLGLVVVGVSSYTYVRWKWKGIDDDAPPRTIVDSLWQFLHPPFFIVLFLVVIGGMAGLVVAFVATVVFHFAWFMLLDVLVSQEAAEAHFAGGSD